VILYQYKAVDSDWFVIAVAGARRHSVSKVSPLETWCDETYDPNTKTKAYAGRNALETDTWGFASGDYYFKNEADAFHFVLRWSGEN
jgi:hypothetical protein